jgi:histone deacetylase 1/2
MSGPDAHFWQAASDREMASHLKNATFTIVPRPHDRNVVSTKFVWKLKNPGTATPTYKARLVARGFSQRYGEDYDDTFSPVPKTTTVRFMFAYAAANNLYAYHFDIETAFLESAIDKLVYAEQPEGYHHPDYPPSEYVLKLNKGIPGLKQGAFLWSSTLKGTLLGLGFRQSNADECLFIRHEGSGNAFIAVWVDDFLILSDSVSRIDTFHADLSMHYTVNNLGPVKRFLGLDVHRPTPTGPIYLAQSTYARKVLHRFGMQNCNPAKVPFGDTAQLHKRHDDEEPADDKLYREIVGSLG